MADTPKFRYNEPVPYAGYDRDLPYPLDAGAAEQYFRDLRTAMGLRSGESLFEAVQWAGKQRTFYLESVAKAIYDAMRETHPGGEDRPWIPGGNSLMQTEARSRARRAIGID